MNITFTQKITINDFFQKKTLHGNIFSNIIYYFQTFPMTEIKKITTNKSFYKC